MRLRQVWLWTCGAVLLSVLGACGTAPERATPGAGATAAGLYLSAVHDTLPDQEPGAWELHLTPADSAGQLCVEVMAHGARNLRSAYFELSYDAARYTPLSANPGALGPAADTLCLAVLDRPGVVRFGQVLRHPQAAPGFSGDGVLARITFASQAYPATAAVRQPSTPPVVNSARALLSWDGAASTLSWDYYNTGDYNQDGVVGLTDLLPLGIYYGAVGPFPLGALESVADGNGDGVLNVADVTPIGSGYGRDALGGYALYTTANIADYPAANIEAPKLAALDFVPLSGAGNLPSAGRLHFNYFVPTPQPGWYYFLRYRDSLGAEGTPTTLAGGAPAALPVLSLDNPPGKGDGSAAQPYWVSGGEQYQLHLQDPAFGDVSTESDTAYYLSDSAAGTIVRSTATFTVEPQWVGSFTISAAYRGAQVAAPLHFYTKPPWSMVHHWIDEGTPASSVVGEYCRIAEIAGEPAVAYYDQTAGVLCYAYYSANAWHCSVIDPATVTGKHVSLSALENGKPVVCYFDQTAQALKYAAAISHQPAGPAEWARHTVAPLYVTETSLALIADCPAIVVNDALTDRLVYLDTHYPYPAEPTDWKMHELEGAGDLAMPSLASVGGMPAVAFYDSASMDLRYAYAKLAIPQATSDWVKYTIDSDDAVGLYPQLAAPGGLNPAIAYFDWTHGDLKFAQAAGSAPHAADWTLSYIDRSADMVGTRIGMASIDSRLCVAYRDYTTGGLWLARQKVSAPDGPQDWQRWVLDNGPDIGDHISMCEVHPTAVGEAAIAYFDNTLGNLGFIWPY